MLVVLVLRLGPWPRDLANNRKGEMGSAATRVEPAKMLSVEVGLSRQGLRLRDFNRDGDGRMNGSLENVHIQIAMESISPCSH